MHPIPGRNVTREEVRNVTEIESTGQDLAEALGLGPAETARRRVCRIFLDQVLANATDYSTTAWETDGIRGVEVIMPEGFAVELVLKPRGAEITCVVGEERGSALVPADTVDILKLKQLAGQHQIRLVQNGDPLSHEVAEQLALARATVSPLARDLADRLDISLAAAGCYLLPLTHWYADHGKVTLIDQQGHKEAAFLLPGGDLYQITRYAAYAIFARFRGSTKRWEDWVPAGLSLVEATPLAELICSRLNPVRSRLSVLRPGQSGAGRSTAPINLDLPSNSR